MVDHHELTASNRRDMTNLDFIEIGTCYFDTLLEKCSDTDLGISIEPIQEYLDLLPNKPGIMKLNAAVITPEDYSKNNGVMDLYHVTYKTIENNNLGLFLTGCNSIGKPHDLHLQYYHNPDVWHLSKDRSKLNTVDLVAKGLVSITPIRCITYQQLIEFYSISAVKFLKIDVEGYDCVLLHSILDFYDDKRDVSPSKIYFETNSHNAEQDVKILNDRLRSFGYKITSDYHDTKAEKIIV